jgi:predicted Zn finger-like uncharacterized protein
MFTVCPKCMLTLAVTANDLRMGQGYVRCGRCANVFNALLTLSEEPSEEHRTSPEPTPADRASSSQIAAALRDEAVTETATSSEPRSQVEAVDGPETQLPTEQSSDGSIETESNFAAGTGTFETIVLEGEAITQIEEYVPEESVNSEIAALTHRLELRSQEPLVSPPTEADDGADGDAQADGDSDGDGDGDGEHLAAESDQGLETSEFERSSPPGSHLLPQQRWPWIAASVALALLLALQMIHHWRDALAASPPLNAPLTRTYAALGMPLDPHWDLAAYDVRQQGAAADPSDNQLIRVRLSLANHAPRAQPLPLLRLTLLDRYGKRVASSDLTPDQYWPGGAPPHAFLGHDERVDSEVSVRDPSAASASFELDVCLRSASGGLRCAGDAGTK